MKMQYGGSEEEIRQLKEQEKLLKEAEEKFKSLESDVKETSDLVKFWQVFKDEFRNRK